MEKGKSDSGAFGIFLITIGAMIIVIAECFYTLTEIWGMQIGGILGLIIIIIGIILLIYEFEFRKPVVR